VVTLSRVSNGIACFCLIGLACLVTKQLRAAERSDLAEFVGTWRGTSTCVNRQVAPSCTDETVVYEVRPPENGKAAVLKADKMVDGRRVPMGELEFVYSDKERCWRSEFTTPRVHGVWCLAIEGRSMTGSLRVLPSNAEVRKVQVKRD
jgi:hypothetical protein